MVHVFGGLGLSAVIDENISRTERLEIQNLLAPVNRSGRNAGASASNTCSFVVADWRSVGDPFCGAPTRAGSPYCARHHCLCILPSGSAEERSRATALVQEADAVPEPPPELAHLKESALPEALPDEAGDLRALLDHLPPDPAEPGRSEP